MKSRYDNVHLRVIDSWLQTGYATNNHVDNTNFDSKEDLANAAAALDGQPTDKDALKAEIAKDPTTKADDKYKNATDEKKEAYDKALEEAKKTRK